MLLNGKFFAFEGVDGSGKTTQIRLLAERLRRMTFSVYETREPTDSPIGSLIRQMMTGRIKSDDKTIAALFVADRLDHLQNNVNGLLAKLQAGAVVLSDRYYFSSYAYHGLHIPMEWVVHANSLCADLLRPSVTVFLDVPPQRCAERLSKSRWHLELYEGVDVLLKVRAMYFEAFNVLKDQEHVLVLDADADPETVAERVWNGVRPYLER